jgi:hypothetical protein
MGPETEQAAGRVPTPPGTGVEALGEVDLVDVAGADVPLRTFHGVR